MAQFYHHHAAPVFAPPPTYHRRAQAYPHPAPAVTPRYPRPRAAQAPAAEHPRHRSTSRAVATTDLDPILLYHTHISNAPIEFDVSLPPAQILVSQGSSRSSYSSLTPRHLSPPAVYPPLSFMRIKCPLLPWPIDVHPDARSGSTVVTVGNVLEAIYSALRHRVSEAEWRAASPETQQRVRHAYLRRCKRQQSHTKRAYEESQGLRRIDWLVMNTAFQGLTPGKSPDRWVMHLRPGEKTVRFVT